METRLLARILAAARTVQPLAAVATLRATEALAGDAETVRAQVTARLADGSFELNVDGKPMTAALPRHVRPGDIVELRITPRNAAPARAHASIEQPAAERLSGAARLIADALGTTRPGPTLEQHPVVPAPPTQGAALREPLARAVEASGLFYESHQARWVDGDFPLERLREEPQARLAAETHGRGAAASDENQAAAVSRPPIPPSALAGEREVASERAPAAPAGTGEPRNETAARNDAVARDALPIVRQQLEALDTRQITWLGEIWPGQPMRWDIGEREPETGRDGEAPGWTTSLALELPMLGDVGARLTIGPPGAFIAIRAGSVHAADMLRAAVPQLAQALASAGVAVVGIEVNSGEHAA